MCVIELKGTNALISYDFFYFDKNLQKIASYEDVSGKYESNIIR